MWSPVISLSHINTTSTNSTFIVPNLCQKTDSRCITPKKTLFNIYKPMTLQGSAPRREKKNGKIRVECFSKEVRLQPWPEGGKWLAGRTVSGSSFQLIGASYAKLRPKCFQELKTKAKWGTSRNIPSDWLRRVLYALCVGIRKGSKYFGLPLCRNLYTRKAVLEIERYLIDNQCSAFLIGVMCEYLAVLATILARLFWTHWRLRRSRPERPLNRELQ